jgi:hypothetical protein
MQILRHSKIAVTMEIYTEVALPRPVMRSGSLAGGWTREHPLLHFAAAPRSKKAGSVAGTCR